MPDKHTVAFLGLGHMGGPMALNLVRAGYRVTAFDVVPAYVGAAGLSLCARGQDEEDGGGQQEEDPTRHAYPLVTRSRRPG